MIVSVWQGAGYIMLIYTAALQNVPQELIEAAKLTEQADGKFFVTLQFQW